MHRTPRLRPKSPGSKPPRSSRPSGGLPSHAEGQVMSEAPQEKHPAVGAHACTGGHGHTHDPAGAAANDDHRVKDPVCGMMVDPHTTPHRAEHEGHPYYFCSNGCHT